MDLCAFQVKNLLHANSFCHRPISSSNGGRAGVSSFRVGDGRVFEKFCCDRYRPFLVTATGKKNPDNSSSSSSSSGNGERSIPEGDGIRGSNSSDGDKSDGSTEKSHHPTNLDWREFRAKLYRDELKAESESDTQNQGGILYNSKNLGTKWAHPIPVPETGCVLVATEKLDGVRTFERTVVLLLRSGSRHPQEGPFGIVINREKLKVPGFEEVIPGLCFGARNSLDDAAALVKKGVLRAQDFRFFVGYAGWQLDQLRDEIQSDYWYVAACSSSLLSSALSDSSEGLWEEILQLMGGHYSELSRKPKQDM
ncbi:hypothetical protein PIB30_041359 [Stylosanthes scabra]|uniref:Uncharacterized protein n=1 Tax=Stylosanthes scabra TaxID=79078 RepID=A0ABU6YC90_9FABA|nr:hypothetical protein [Stylosanthes scabra]